jgi:TolA-binding protein
LWGLGRKDEAKKIWAELAAKYPKHELAPESLKLSKQA